MVVFNYLEPQTNSLAAQLVTYFLPGARLQIDGFFEASIQSRRLQGKYLFIVYMKVENLNESRITLFEPQLHWYGRSE